MCYSKINELKNLLCYNKLQNHFGDFDLVLFPVYYLRIRQKDTLPVKMSLIFTVFLMFYLQNFFFFYEHYSAYKLSLLFSE